MPKSPRVSSAELLARAVAPHRGRAHPPALRARALLQCERGVPVKLVASLLMVPPRTIYRWRELYDDTGTLGDRSRGTPRDGELDSIHAFVAWLLHHHPELTNGSIAEAVRDVYSRPYSRQSVTRATHRLGIRFKRARYCALQQDPAERVSWFCNPPTAVEPERPGVRGLCALELVDVDESALYLADAYKGEVRAVRGYRQC